MKNWNEMCGQILKLAFIDGDDLVVATTLGTWVWTPEGDCCAQASLDTDGIVLEEMAALSGQDLIRAEAESGGSEEGCDLGHDITFYKIIGEESDVTFTLHVRHNGYYAGRLTLKSYEEKSILELLADTGKTADFN